MSGVLWRGARLSSALRTAVRPRLTTSSAVRSFSAVQNGNNKTPQLPSHGDELEDGEVLLYKKSNHMKILLLLGVSGVNLMYWTSQIAHYWMYKDLVVQGISLAGDPVWGTFGLACTGGFLWFTKSYANHTAYQCYQSADGKRIGFQTHTMLGKPGRRFEVSVGNAKFLQRVNDITRTPAEREAYTAQNSGIVNKMMSTSYVPANVKGFKGNLLLDSEGTFYEKDRLVSLFEAPEGFAQAAQSEVSTEAGGRKQAPHRFNKRK